MGTYLSNPRTRVSQACDVCPTGRFYAVLVPAEDAERLLAEGWGPREELPG